MPLPSTITFKYHSADYSELCEVAEFSMISTKNSSHPFSTNSGNLVPLTSLPSH